MTRAAVKSCSTGKPIGGPGPDRGMVFQGYTLFPWRTVKRERDVRPGDARQRPAHCAEEEARPWLEMVGLAEFENPIRTNSPAA